MTSVIQAQTSETIENSGEVILDIGSASNLAYTVTTVDTTPEAEEALTCADDEITFADPTAFFANLKVQVSSTGDLPTGLLVETDYYVSVIDGTTIELLDEPNGDVVTFSDDGTGTVTVTPVALDASFTPSWSIDGENYFPIESPVDTTDGVTVGRAYTSAPYKYIKIALDLADGYADTVVSYLIKIDI